MHTEPTTENRIIPFAVEAAWATGRWNAMKKFSDRFHGNSFEDFNVSLACLFGDMRTGWTPTTFDKNIRLMREKLAASMTLSATSSLSSCHDIMLRCHVLAELEILVNAQSREGQDHLQTLATLNRRLEVLGAYVNDKQYLLGIRRAAMQLLK
jgi:serine/threonine-protein kinase ATR